MVRPQSLGYLLLISFFGHGECGFQGLISRTGVSPISDLLAAADECDGSDLLELDLSRQAAAPALQPVLQNYNKALLPGHCRKNQTVPLVYSSTNIAPNSVSHWKMRLTVCLAILLCLCIAVPLLGIAVGVAVRALGEEKQLAQQQQQLYQQLHLQQQQQQAQFEAAEELLDSYTVNIENVIATNELEFLSRLAGHLAECEGAYLETMQGAVSDICDNDEDDAAMKAELQMLRTQLVAALPPTPTEYLPPTPRAVLRQTKVLPRRKVRPPQPPAPIDFPELPALL